LDAAAQPAVRETIQSGVMIEKFAGIFRTFCSGFLDLNHTSQPMIPVAFQIPKFVSGPS
jgi:hypothetical protein